MNYKDTLLMPKTDFEMRGNLPKKEPKYVERWKYAHGAYVKQSHQRRYLPL